MQRSEVMSLVVRYGILLLVGLTNIFWGERALFYQIFTPLTVGPVAFIFHALYGEIARFGPTTLFLKGYYASIIPACVAGSAYYLLLILNMTTPMGLGKRVGCLIYTGGLFLISNILRIVLFGILLTKGHQYFDIAHLATWYAGSTLLVALIWFSAILVFHIREAPVFTDLQALVKDIREKHS